MRRGDSVIRKDIYDSRSKESWEFVERIDPVTYQSKTVTRNPLTPSQLNFYEENGFLFIEQLFNEAEIHKINTEAQILANDAFGWPPTEERVIKEPDSNEVRSVFDVHKYEDTFRRLCCTPRLADAARQILGSEVYIHQSRINYKPGFVGKEFYWHSDFETWHMEDGMPCMRAVSCAILLTDNNEFNGPLMLIPRSHKYYVTCVGETPEDHYRMSLRKQEYGVPSEAALAALTKEGGLFAVKGPAGSVVFFDCNTMHGSTGNLSPYPRHNVFYVYNSIENTLVDPYAGTRPRPDFIANRQFTPLSKLN